MQPAEFGQEEQSQVGLSGFEGNWESLGLVLVFMH